MCPEIKLTLTEFYKNTTLNDSALWFEKVMDYNVPHGKKNRGNLVVSGYIYLNNSDLLEKDIKKAYLLGWCIEFFQAYFLIADDIMDQSLTRRGQPCWYKNVGVGNIAINDAQFIQSSVYMLLKKYCGESKYYCKLLELFIEINNKTIYGQCLDVLTSNPLLPENNNFSQFKLERYAAIIKYKTIYYSFYLPILIALTMSDMDTPDNIQKSKIILYFMGYYFQVQDDYLDCFGDPNVTGKIGTDIQDFKCSWLIVNALRKASPEQRILLEENYGKDDSVKIAKVKEVYVDLALPQHFKKFEDLYTELITFLIQCLPDVMPGDQEKETNIKLSHRLDEFKQKHSDFDELFPGDYKEIPDGIFNLSNGFNTDDLVELDSIVGDGGCKRVLPKELFWHYHNLIYKRVK